MDEFLKALGKFFGTSILAIGNFFAWSFVVLKLYTWFLLPVFNVPEITYWQAAGLWVLTALVKNTHISHIKDEYKIDKTTQYIMAIIAPWLVLLIGLIIK